MTKKIKYVLLFRSTVRLLLNLFIFQLIEIPQCSPVKGASMHIKDEIGSNKGDTMEEKERFGELCQYKSAFKSLIDKIKSEINEIWNIKLPYQIKLLQGVKAEKVFTQIPRGFKEDPSEEYCEGYILSQPESDGTLATRCFEFKYFADCVNNSTKNILVKFLIEVLKFSCGCLNKRRNGTICFGIADNCIKKSDYENYKHGEIVGFPLDNHGLNSKKMYTDALREAILLCFDDKSAAFAAKCISDPKFLKVKIAGGKKCRYVMEVDVEASFMFCTYLYFTVNLHKLKKSSFIESINIEKLGNKFLNTDKDFLFLRKGSSTERIENKSKQYFIKKTLLDLVVSRICFEIREPNFTLSKKFYHALQQIQRYYHTDSENCAFEIIRDILYYVVMPLKDHNGNATLESALDIPCSIEHNRNLRSFRENPDTRIYSKGYILIKQKTNETIATKLTEFKNVDCFENQEKNFFGIFVKDVLEFVDSCLNSRRFGTIYFGVEDIPLKDLNSKYKIVKFSGVNIDENNSNSRFKYTDALRNAISKNYPRHKSDIVKECVSNPLFVKVKIQGKNKFSHVIEVDIDPSSIFCKRLSFTNQENKRKREHWQCVQEGSAIKINENNVESSSVNEELTKLVKNRYSFEMKKICHKIIDSKRKSENS